MIPIAPPSGIRARLREFYNSSRAYADHLTVENEAYFKRYLSLIEQYASHAQMVLDAGCGTGLSSRLLAEAGKKVVGVDLSELFLRQGRRTSENQNPCFSVADILSLPFQDASFDLVGSYLVIEFLPDVERGLEEMIRVLRKGGILVLVAPNHLSPIWPLADFFRMIREGPPRPVWCETPEAALRTCWRNILLTLRKSFQTGPEFLYREPDLTCRTVVGQDSDSVYVACPTDLARFLNRRGFRILRRGGQSMLLEKLFPALSVAVEVVAEKT